MPATAPNHDVPVIYNLFPSLLGDVDKWLPHVIRAAEMGFNWLFLNPIHLTGASGSLYSIRDYFRLSPVFFPSGDFDSQKARLARFVTECRDAGVEVMADLVVNHTAYDNPLTREKRQWYRLNPDGSIQNPGAVDDTAPGGRVVWGDLSEIDNEHSSDRGNLWEYWWSVVDMFLSCGVRGFRCDAAYQVPIDLWRLLIQRAKGKHPECRFFAESLGCPMEKTLSLARAGHDFVFNSGKWWNYKDGWFPEQMRAGAGVARSVCFAESHDTRRLAEEWNGDVDRVKQHYLFSALVSTGVLALIGFEYGFRKKPHVVHTNPFDYEGAHYDLTDYIRDVNRLKFAHRVFHEDNRLEMLDLGRGEVTAFRKTTLDGKESGVLLFNNTDRPQELSLADVTARARLPAYRSDPKAANVPVPGAAQTLKLGRYGATAFRVF